MSRTKKLRRGGKRFGLELDREEFDALSAIARSERLPRTFIVRTALKKYIKEFAKKANSK